MKVVGGRDHGSGDAPHPRKLSLKKTDRTDGIDPYDFWVPPPNRDGGETPRITTRIDHDASSQIEELVSGRVFRWKNSQDFARWAIIRGLEEAAKYARDPEINNAVETMAAVHRILRFKQKMEDLDVMVKGMRDMLSKLLARGAHRQVKQEVEGLRARVGKMRDSFWRQSCESVLSEYDQAIHSDNTKRDLLKRQRNERQRERDRREREYRAKTDKRAITRRKHRG